VTNTDVAYHKLVSIRYKPSSHLRGTVAQFYARRRAKPWRNVKCELNETVNYVWNMTDSER